MKTPPRAAPVAARLLPLFLAGFLIGCATQRQVQDIVDESNLASLNAELQLDNADPSKPGGTGTAWQTASAKVEAFVAAHPENKETIASLRVRQAVLLLNNRQFNLAEAAFNEASLDHLHTDRDRTLKRLEKDLLWWYRSAEGSLGPSDFTMGDGVLARLSSSWTELRAAEDESMRDWLAALRAWVGLKLANDVSGTNQARVYLEDAINTYATTLPPGEAARWQTETNWPPDNVTPSMPISASNRRRFRAEAIIAGARTAIRQNAIPLPQINEPYFRTRIER